MASTASEVKFREERSTSKLSSYGSTGGAGLEIGMRGPGLPVVRVLAVAAGGSSLPAKKATWHQR